LTYEVFTSLKNQFESKPVEACVSVLTSHIQTLGLFDAISMQWNNVVVEFFGISSGVTNIDLSIYSDECIYGDLLKGRSRLFLSNIVIIATPFFYWILMVLIWFVKHLVVKGGLIRRKTNRFKQNQSDELQTKNTTGSEEPPISPEKRAMGTEVTPKRIMEFKNTLLKPQLPFQYKFLSIFGLIINLMFPLLVKSAITNLQCIQLDSREPDKTYLKISPEITCWEGQHLAVVLWIGLPLLIFFGFIYPIFLATILYASAKSLTKPNYVYAFSFAFINYKRERYFWHSFMYFRSVSLLVITSASVDLGLTSRSSFLLSMCVLFYLLNTAARPFIEDEINKLQQISSLCILITVAAAILSVSGGTVGAFVSWFAFSINIGFIFWWLKCYMRLKKKMRALSMNEDKNNLASKNGLQKCRNLR
jgi:hypothetical protein